MNPDFKDTIDVIQKFASIIASLSILVACAAYILQRRIAAQNHERSRREKAIEIIRTFSTSLNAQSAATHKLIEKLPPEELLLLDSGKQFKISSSEKLQIEAALPGEKFEVSEEDSTIMVNNKQSYQLRFQALEILNGAEIVFQAWDRDVADAHIILQEMRFLYEPNGSPPTTFMENYRKAFTAKDNFPALYKYLEFRTKGSTRPIQTN